MKDDITQQIFLELVKRTNLAIDPRVNIYGNTIWLDDIGWGIIDNKLAVRVKKTPPKIDDDNDVSSEYDLPKNFFGYSPIQFEFARIANRIKKANNEKFRLKYETEQKTKKELAENQKMTREMLNKMHIENYLKISLD